MLRASTPRVLSALVVASVLAVTTVSVTARADDAIAAEALFKEGRSLLDKGRSEEAADRFLRSQKLDRSVGTLLNLGESYERLARFASAWGAFRQAYDLAIERRDPTRAKIAEDRASRVERRMAHLTIAIEAATPGLSVTRNAAPIDPAAYETPIPVDPGSQVVVATAKGRLTWQTTLELGEGESGTARVPPLEPEPVPVETPPVAPVAPPPDTRSKVALGLEIGGGVVLGAGLVFGAFALAKWSSVTDTCPDARCANEADRARREGDASTASTYATVSTIATSVGAVALAAGIVLHLTAPQKRVSVVPMFDRNGGGFLATLRL